MPWVCKRVHFPKLREEWGHGAAWSEKTRKNKMGISTLEEAAQGDTAHLWPWLRRGEQLAVEVLPCSLKRTCRAKKGNLQRQLWAEMAEGEQQAVPKEGPAHLCSGSWRKVSKAASEFPDWDEYICGTPWSCGAGRLNLSSVLLCPACEPGQVISLLWVFPTVKHKNTADRAFLILKSKMTQKDLDFEEFQIFRSRMHNQ